MTRRVLAIVLAAGALAGCALKPMPLIVDGIPVYYDRVEREDRRFREAFNDLAGFALSSFLGGVRL